MCPHTGEKWGVCHRERGVSTDRRECAHTQMDSHMCFIRMHTALDCAVCGRACVCVCACVGVRVCGSVNMPVSCALYVRVIDDQAFLSAKLSYNSTKIHSRV